MGDSLVDAQQNVSSASIEKTVLDNGLHVLIKNIPHLPRVALQLWYNVGSKHEGATERGMAHLLEHMTFKGTEWLSESDINLITHKIAGYSNAFTSYDYTSYIFQVPSNRLTEPLSILADCMKNCTFRPEMLSSEVLAVIQEMKMYKDDYQNILIESLMGVVFPEHPYHHPIIGYKQDLCGLTSQDLLAFYKKHYHPQNATLVAVGDIQKEAFLKEVSNLFGDIKPHELAPERPLFFNEDIASKSVTLYRPVQNPWCCYLYLIPGMESSKLYLFDMIAMVLGTGKSSRLYQDLVDKEHLATDVESFTYDLFGKSLLLITVQPKDQSCIPAIESHINGQLNVLADHPIEEWELSRVKKHIMFEHALLLESNEKQASLIGSAYLATKDENYVENYLERIRITTTEDIQRGIAEFLRETMQHKGYLLPLHKHDTKHFVRLQEESDELDNKVLGNFRRTLPVEEGKAVNEIALKTPPQFNYPQPTIFKLSNGAEVLFYDDSRTPQLSLILHLKADHFYDPPGQEGIAYFVSKMLVEGTRRHSAAQLSRMLEVDGIYITVAAGILSVQMIPESLEKGLNVLGEILIESIFEDSCVEKVRKHILSEIDDYWDSPLDCVEQVAREVVYKKEHPFAKNHLGDKKVVAQLRREDLINHYIKNLSPHGAVISLVGDLNLYPQSELECLFEKTLGQWQGEPIKTLVAPPITYEKPIIVERQINRDQVVLGFVAPSVSRADKDYEVLALLDVALTGGEVLSMHSRLFQLREQTGIFYTVGGSLVHEARSQPGMVFIKTIVSLDKVKAAEEAIVGVIDELGRNGITQEELDMARNVLLSSSVGYFESTIKMAQEFLFLKICGLDFDLFDKRQKVLAELDLAHVNSVARKFCTKDVLSVIRIGRIS